MKVNLTKSQLRFYPRRGFTFVELVLVLAIIGSLAVLLLPLTMHHGESSKNSLTTLSSSQAGLDPNSANDYLDLAFDLGAAPVANTAETHQVDFDGTDNRPRMAVLRDNGTQLVLFDADTPGNGTLLDLVGLETNERVIAMDAEVSTGRLIGVTDFNRIVHIITTGGNVVHISTMSQGFNDENLIAIATFFNFYVDSKGYQENVYGMQEKWIRSDVMNSLGSPWFYILPTGELYEHGAGGPNLLMRVGKNAYENPEMLISASLTALQVNGNDNNPLDAEEADLDLHLFRSSSGNFYYNAFGAQEKWIKGEQARKSVSGRNNPWYLLFPSGALTEWNGTPGNPIGVPAGNYGPEAWRKPSLLYDANPTNVSSGMMGQQTVAETYDFHFPHAGDLSRNLYEDSRLDLDLKWFYGDRLATNNPYYIFSPDGSIIKWDGNQNDVVPNGNLIILLGDAQVAAWDRIEDVVNDFPKLNDPEAVAADQRYGFYRASKDNSFFFNAHGRQEKWLRGDPTMKSLSGQNNNWFVILPGGVVCEWDGTPGQPFGSFIGFFGDAAYERPGSLCDAYADGTVFNGLPPSPFSILQIGEGERLNFDTITNDLHGADIDPVTGRLTIVATDDHVLSVDIETGRTIRLPNINAVNESEPFARPEEVAAIAYTNSFVDPPNDTVAFLLDTANPDALELYNPVSGIAVKGDGDETGIDSSNKAGFEIIGDGTAQRALAVLTVGGVSGLYRVDLGSGNAVLLGGIQIGGGGPLSDLNDIAVDLMNDALARDNP